MRIDRPAEGWRSDHILDRLANSFDIGNLKIALVNVMSFVVIAILSGSPKTAIFLATYTLVTFAYIRWLDLCNSERLRAWMYFTFLFGHAAAFLLLQHRGFIGILNIENATAPKTLPYLVGFSFYILQTLTICGAVYRRFIEPLNLQRYILALTFCGAFLAGPLFNHAEIKKFRTLDINLPSLESIYAGLHLLLGALLFKLVIANWLAQWVDINETASPLAVTRSIGAFELQVYFDFAGYSLIALFICRIFAVPMYFNFHHPFAARDIPEFWRRWHVGLGTWFKENVFLPLRAAMGTKWAARSVGPLAVFFVSAAWHGPTRNFLSWGLFHGLAFLFAIHVISRTTHLWVGRLLSRLFVFVVIFYGRLLFMDSNVPRLMMKFRSLGMFKRLVHEFIDIVPTTLETWQAMLLTHWDHVAVGLLMGFFIAYEVLHPAARSGEPYQYFKPGVVSVLMFIVILLFFKPMSGSGFVYGR